MTPSPDDLNIKTLAYHCQRESNQYLAGKPNDEIYCLELFRRAILQHNQEAWQAIYTQFQSLVADWIWQHSKFQSIQEDVAVLVNVTFARFWRTASKRGQSFPFNRLGKLLRYLKYCAFSAIEDAYRQQQRGPGEMLILDELAEVLTDDVASPETYILSQLEMEALGWAVWSRLQNTEETLVATMSWLHCLSPREIQTQHPDLFVSVRDVYRIKRNILDRLLRDPDVQKFHRQMR